MHKKCTAWLAAIMILWSLAAHIPFGLAAEKYVITTADGARIVARDYTFTKDRVEYTTENGLPGFIRREDFRAIVNIKGVEQAADPRLVSQQQDKKFLIRIGAAAGALLLALLLVVLIARTKEKKGSDQHDFYYGREQQEPLTHGHLAFQYRGFLGKRSQWVIEVRDAYTEEGLLIIEGICTATGRRKTFRADRVAGMVTDRSTEQQAPVEHFFKPEEREA